MGYSPWSHRESESAHTFLIHKIMKSRLLSKSKNWGPDRAKDFDSVSQHKGLTGRSRSSYSKSYGLPLRFKSSTLVIQSPSRVPLSTTMWTTTHQAQPPGSLKFFQDIQECYMHIWICSICVYWKGNVLSWVCLQSLTQNWVFFLGKFKTHYTQTWFMSVWSLFIDHHCSWSCQFDHMLSWVCL